MRIVAIIALLMSEGAMAQNAQNAQDAQDTPGLMVRAHLEPSGTVVAGSEVKLIVDCLTTTFFSEAPDWPLFDVPGALVVLPDEQAENLHETIDGVAWYGVSRVYRVIPQTAGMIGIPSFNIIVHPGGKDTSATLTTPSLKFAASIPPGAEGMRVFFPTQKLSAVQTFTPALHDLKAGGSVTRTITQTAAGSDAMLIPPVNFSGVDGLKPYPKPPSTKNVIQDRAGLVAGQRTDSVTYVIKRSGRFTLPPVTIEWWNTATQKQETIVLPAAGFSAAPAKEKPFFSIPADALSKGGAHRILVIDRWQAILAMLLLVLALASIWVYPRLASRFRRVRRALVEARDRYRNGAAPAWRALRVAVRGGDAEFIVPSLYRWMDRCPDLNHPARVDELKSPGEPRIDELESVVLAHYSGEPQVVSELRESIKALNRVVRQTRKSRPLKSPLPPLNKY